MYFLSSIPITVHIGSLSPPADTPENIALLVLETSYCPFFLYPPALVTAWLLWRCIRIDPFLLISVSLLNHSLGTCTGSGCGGVRSSPYGDVLHSHCSRHCIGMAVAPGLMYLHPTPERHLSRPFLLWVQAARQSGSHSTRHWWAPKTGHLMPYQYVE